MNTKKPEKIESSVFSMRHVQITQGLMRGFSTKKNKTKTYYLDLKTNQIQTSKIKELGAEPDYYEDEIEEILSSYESDFGVVDKKIREFQKGKLKEFVFTEEEEQSIRDFFKFQSLRSKKKLEYLKKNSLVPQIIKGFNQNNLIYFGEKKYFDKMYEDKYPVIIVNNNSNDIGFILPSNTYYYLESETWIHGAIIMPVSPSVAIGLLNKVDYDVYLEKENETLYLNYINLITGNNIDLFNKYALISERVTNNEFLVGRKKDLERITLYLQDL